MNFEEFKSKFAEDVKARLDAQDGIKVEVTTEIIRKINDSYDAVVVKEADGNIGVNLNMNVFYDAMDNLSYEEVLDKAVETYMQGKEKIPDFDFSMFTDYEYMKDRLTIEAVSAEKNQDILERVPHKMMEDIAMVYRFEIGSDAGGRSSVLITNDHLKTFGITPEELHEDAVRNASEFKPLVIKSMRETLLEIGGDILEELGIPEQSPIDDVMYVVSVPDKTHGASVLAYQDFMDRATETMGGDFYILPSSIHELILIKDDGSQNYKELEEMVQTINETQVLPEERLTDSVYHYDAKDQVFELAEKYEARKMEKEVAVEGKESVLKELNKKKEEVSKAPVKDAVEKSVKNRGGEAL